MKNQISSIFNPVSNCRWWFGSGVLCIRIALALLTGGFSEWVCASWENENVCSKPFTRIAAPSLPMTIFFIHFILLLSHLLSRSSGLSFIRSTIFFVFHSMRVLFFLSSFFFRVFFGLFFCSVFLFFSSPVFFWNCVLCSFRRMYCQYIRAPTGNTCESISRSHTANTIHSLCAHTKHIIVAGALGIFSIWLLLLVVCAVLLHHSVCFLQCTHREREIIFYCVLCAL